MGGFQKDGAPILSGPLHKLGGFSSSSEWKFSGSLHLPYVKHISDENGGAMVQQYTVSLQSKQAYIVSLLSIFFPNIFFQNRLPMLTCALQETL